MAQLEEIITADSTPDYDSWGPDTYWSCDQWIQYHKALKEKWGQDKANKIWLDAFEKQDSFEHAYNWCKYDAAFADYFAKQGLSVGNIFSKIVNSGGKLVDAVSNVASTASSSTNALKFVGPALVVTAGILLIFWGYKKVKSA